MKYEFLLGDYKEEKTLSTWHEFKNFRTGEVNINGISYNEYLVDCARTFGLDTLVELGDHGCLVIDVRGSGNPKFPYTLRLAQMS